MPLNFRHRSSSVGSQQSDAGRYGSNMVESLDPILDDDEKQMTVEDVDASRRLLGSLLYMKDNSGRSFLHTQFQLSWAKALLDRAKSLDDWCSENVYNAVNGNKNHGIKQKTESTLLQRRFLLQKDQESGYTPLHRAIVEGNLAAVLLFLRHAMDVTSTGRLTQRPLQVLHTADSFNAGDSSNNSSSNQDSLLHLMASAVDKDGLTPLRLLGELQRSELQKCREALEQCQPKVDLKATTRLRPRQNSFNEHDGSDGVDFFSENGDLLQINNNDENEDVSRNETVSYACEVMTFGRPQHYALGVVQGISSSASMSATTDNRQYSHSSAFTTHRVQEFAQETVGRDGAAIAVAAASHHTLVVTKNGHLYACGLGKGGRLGLGDVQTQHCPLPRRVLGPLQRRRVVNVSAAENHSLCVTKEGTVFSWGSNRFGQLGDGTVAVSAGSRSVPRRVDDLKSHPCVAVAAGERHSVALSRKGEVFVWGDNACGQLGVPRRSGVQRVQRVEALWSSSATPKIAIAIAAADQSTLVLTTASSSGLAYVNSVYEWGHGNHVPIKVHFENGRLKDINGNKRTGNTSGAERVVNPVAIASGKFHNAVITSDGLVYTWGLHADSLGRTTTSKSTMQQQRRNALPQLVSGMLTENGGGRAVAIAASDQRTAVVCDNGALFTWGTTDGKNIQGHEGVRWQHLPRQVPGVHRAVNVAVAKEHTVLLVGAGFPYIPKAKGLLSLDIVAARNAAKHVDLFNVVPILIMAERTECHFLTSYCSDFLRRNLDGVLNAGKKSVMNQYLNDKLADTTHRSGKRFRDDHHHPFIFDVIQAGNEESPSFGRAWLSTLKEWTRSCNQLAQLPVVQKLLLIADQKEFEEDTANISAKVRRSSSCYSDGGDGKIRARSLSGRAELEGKDKVNLQGHLNACKDRTTSMDLSTVQRANENSVWLAKEIRGVRKKLKQISHLLESQSKSIVLTTEQRAKVDRRLVLEAELSVYESAMEDVEKRIKELNENSTEITPSTSTSSNICRDKINPSTKVSFSGKKLDEIPEKMDRPFKEQDVGEETKADKVYFCDLCGVRCSDKSNLLLHQNGRKHRNRELQAAEQEKKKAAVSILEQRQLDEMKNPSMCITSVKPPQKNAWGTDSTPPKFKLPPPPHPVVPHVTPVLQQSTKWKTSNGCKIEKSRATSAGSNFEQILNNTRQRSSTSTTSEAIVTTLWDSSPGSARCVPISLYAARDMTETGNRGSLSLGDFLAPTSQKTSHSSKTAVAPWLSPSSVASPSSKSLMDIQAEEANLKSREDKGSGIHGGRWYVERRERASSLLEIQKGTEQEEEERLLIAEQFEIEAQIMEQNRKSKEQKASGNAASKRRYKSSKRSKQLPIDNVDAFTKECIKPKTHQRSKRTTKQQTGQSK